MSFVWSQKHLDIFLHKKIQNLKYRYQVIYYLYLPLQQVTSSITIFYLTRYVRYARQSCTNNLSHAIIAIIYRLPEQNLRVKSRVGLYFYENFVLQQLSLVSGSI